jgi:hypothetical protein
MNRKILVHLQTFLKKFLLMSRISTPPDLSFIQKKRLMERADFLQQDEQEVLQLIEQELDQLLRDPSELSIKKILIYAALH